MITVTEARASGRTRRPLDLTNVATVRAVARRVGLRPSKRLGQHFLVDRHSLEVIIEALGSGAADDVLEIGCGMGTLTAALAERARRVVAIDVDPRCVEATRITQRARDNVTVLEMDALALQPENVGLGERWLAAGNLPYQLTGAILGRLFEMPRPPAVGVFLVQREVAARLSSVEQEWSLATVALRSVASIERLADLAPAAFEPPPAVHSSVIRLRPDPALAPAERRAVLALARTVFQQRRKTLRQGLARALGGDRATAGAVLGEAGIDPMRRPGTLDLDEWRRLAGRAARVRPQQR